MLYGLAISFLVFEFVTFYPKAQPILSHLKKVSRTAITYYFTIGIIKHKENLGKAIRNYKGKIHENNREALKHLESKKRLRNDT